MKKPILILYLLLVAVCALGVSATSSDSTKYTIRYVDKLKDGNASFENQSLPAKARRLSSTRGCINLIYNDDLPDSIKVALSAAASLWEGKISNMEPIYIEVNFALIDPDIVVAADVYYYPQVLGDNNTYCIPSSLKSQIQKSPTGNQLDPDGFIYLNPEIKWNCNFATEPTVDYNIITMAMRGIALCLGFGSDVAEVDLNKFQYAFYRPTVFDSYLHRGTSYLTDYEVESIGMANFVTSNNVYFKSQAGDYKMYAPTEFIPDVSLRYFEDDASLMSYSLGRGNTMLTIDEKTIDVLRTIGWALPSNSLRIKSNDIGDDGIGSSYTSHTFYLDNGENAASNLQWRFLLKNKSGQFDEISTGTGNSFTIAKVGSPNNYYVNVDGDLEGRIECSYTLNGQSHQAIPFSLSLELKPSILWISDVKKHYTSEYGFYVTATVCYTGADKLYTRVEEDYSFGERVYWCYEPYIAHIKTGIITNLYYSWVTVEVENQYGIAEQTIEFEPDFEDPNEFVTHIGAISPADKSIDKIQIVNLLGERVYEGSIEGFVSTNVASGLYLRRVYLTNGTTNTTKILIK